MARARPASDAPRVLRAGPHDAFIVKPAGLSVELPGDRAGVALLAWVRHTLRRPEARLPHRIDRMARGLVVVALDAAAAAFHSRMVAEGRWRKHYLARVAIDSVEPGDDRGLAKALGSIMGRHRLHLRERGRRAEVVRSGGRPAALEVLAWAPDARAAARRGDRSDARGSAEAHLLVRLETGRFHQVRATLAHLGAPIAGDELYDVGAARRWRAPYLEHALLWLPPFAPDSASQEPLQLVFDPDDPQREPIAPQLREALLRLTEAPPASP